MIINESSWHFKLYNLSYRVWNLYPPSRMNLCAYVRDTILRLLGCLLFWGFICFATGTLLFVLAVGAYHHPLVALAIVGSISAVCIFAYWYTKSDTDLLIHNWVDSKTKGICPTITFKRDNNAD